MSTYLKSITPDFLKSPVGGIPVSVYALIGITTGILAYTTLADESDGQSTVDNTSSILPTLDLFDKEDTPQQSGGSRKHKKRVRKTPRKHGRGTHKTRQ